MNLASIGTPLLHSTADLTAREVRNSPEQEVAAQFEGVFMSMILKQMRETLDQGLFGGDKSDTLGAIFDMHMGQHLANGGGLGLREVITSQYMNSTKL